MISLDNIEFSYTKKGAPALKGLTASVEPGIHLLAGENGAGKTTLLHIIAGLSYPTAGSCKIDGVESTTNRPSEMGRAFLLEEQMFFPGKTIRQFAEMHSRFYPRFSQDKFVANLLAFGLNGDEPLKSLSLGNRKKAQLAYALALGVDVLLLDEPTNALDIQSKETLRKLMVSSIEDNQTVIVSTHTVTELENIFDGVIMLNRGSLIYSGTGEEVTDKLAFEVSRAPQTEAIYTEVQIGRVLCILPALPDDEPTRVDWRLLYSALHSPQREIVLKTLTEDRDADN